MLRTADQVGPDDRRVMVEPETPVRCDARGHRRALRLALIDRGQPAREQDLAADLQLLGRLVTGIDAPRRLQPFELGFIEREQLRLPRRAVDIEPQPPENRAAGRDMPPRPETPGEGK